MRSLSSSSFPHPSFTLLVLLLAACSEAPRDPPLDAPGADASSDTGMGTSGGPPAPTSDGGAPLLPDGGGTLPDGGAIAPPIPDVPFVDFQVNHVLITGQSNAVANSATPVLSTTQPYANLMFNTGVMPMTACDGAGCKAYDTPSSFVPLVEGDRFFNYGVETPSAGVANEISLLAKDLNAKGLVPGLPAGHDVLVSLHGRSGNTYWCLRKGGCDYKPGYLSPFDQALMEVTSAKAIAAATNKSYVVRAALTVHGESDHYSYTDGSQEFPFAGTDGTPGKIATYADALLEWQHDYETSVKAITGQTQGVPLLVSQVSGWNDTRYSRVAQFQLDAHIRAPQKVLLVGPSYFLSVNESDCRHFTNVGERRLGEYFAKVYARVILEGRPWEPVRPKAVTRDGAVITVTFHVPTPPLVIDTQRVAEAASYGFTYADDSSAPPAIASVAVTGPETVTITLAAPPGTGGHLMYAQNQTPFTCIGPQHGARGNLRDSDATPSKHGYDLHNWSVHFDVPVP